MLCLLGLSWLALFIFTVLPYDPVDHSGGTSDHPALIKYACDLMTNVRLVPPAIVNVPQEDSDNDTNSSKWRGSSSSELMSVILGGKPVLAMAFDNMVVRKIQCSSVPVLSRS